MASLILCACNPNPVRLNHFVMCGRAVTPNFMVLTPTQVSLTEVVSGFSL